MPRQDGRSYAALVILSPHFVARTGAELLRERCRLRKVVIRAARESETAPRSRARKILYLQDGTRRSAITLRARSAQPSRRHLALSISRCGSHLVRWPTAASLMSMVQTKRFDPTPVLTHSFSLDEIVEAYDLFGSRRDGVLKVAIRP
jgi:hypothetical protein